MDHEMHHISHHSPCESLFASTNDSLLMVVIDALQSGIKYIYSRSSERHHIGYTVDDVRLCLFDPMPWLTQVGI